MIYRLINDYSILKLVNIRDFVLISLITKSQRRHQLTKIQILQYDFYFSLIFFSQIFPIPFGNVLHVKFYIFTFRNVGFEKIALPQFLVFQFLYVQ